MSKLYERCKKCVDSTLIDWSKMPLRHGVSVRQKMTESEFVVSGIVRLALYILNFDEYCKLKRYIYEQHGYDVGGATDNQMSLEDYQ